MKKTLILLHFIIFYSITAICQTADFTWQTVTGLYCSPSSIKFTQLATGSPTGFVWTFGNNSGSNLANPVASYATAGTFTVRLIVIYKKNTVTVTKTIVIHPAVIAHFTIDRNNICTPGIIRFAATPYQNISSYEWNFGDNSPIISSTSPNINHNFLNYGTYPISMKVTLLTGCYDQSFTSVTVKRPVINGTVSAMSGCVPAMINFNATTELPMTATVTSYIWNFGDGTASTITTVPNTSHSYMSAGNFIPSLHITTNEGCNNDFIFREINFGTPPTNHIAYAKKTIVCGSENPYFVSKAINANKYFWNFGDGDTTSVTDTIIQHKFRTLGTKTIKVTPLYNDCPGTPVSFTINVIGVIAGYDYANTCNDTKRFTFINTTQGNQSTIKWIFGDSSLALTTINTIHSYPDTGTFLTSLIVFDSTTSCGDTYSRNIYTAIPLLRNPDTSICKNANTTFSIPQNFNNPDAIYNWHVAGIEIGPGNTVPLTIQATVHGIFNNNFVTIDNGPQYCPVKVDLNNNIVVRGPVLNFNAPASLCVGKEYVTTNMSGPYFPNDDINEWRWSYGITGDKDSVFQPLPYQFPYWGTFAVKLTAIDINGCMDTLVKNVTSYDLPFLRTIPDVDTLCSGQSATLIAFHNDPINWSPGNAISCSTCDTVIVNPSATTTYYIKATSRYNCIITDSILINVYSPFIAIAKKADNYICSGKSVQLGITTVMKKISWYPVEGLSDSSILNPIASPGHNITYTATLIDSVGCFSSSAIINVYINPTPTVDAGPDKVYPYNSNFSLAPLYGNNISTYNWEPSRPLSCSNCNLPNGIANSSQTFTITVASDSGCTASDQVKIMVECKGANLLLPTAFTPNGDNLNDYYYPITRGINKIIRFSVFNRQGQLVFEAKDMIPNSKSSGWNGNVKGIPQTSASYVYSLEAICDAGETLYQKGSFVLIR